MKRKEFIKNMASATASLALMHKAPALGAINMTVPDQTPGANSKMKLAISAFSYEKEFNEGKHFEEIVEDMADIGAAGIEILGETHIPDYPNPSQAWVEQWYIMLQNFNLKPVAYDLFVDTKFYKNRLLTTKEALQFLIRDFRLANKLGLKIIRQQVAPYPADNPADSYLAPYVKSKPSMELLEMAIPYAEENGVIMAVELHSPTRLKSPWIDSCLELIEKTKTKNLGFCPDLSSFVYTPPRSNVEAILAQGARKEIVDFIISAYQKQLGFEKTMEEVAKMGGNEVEKRYASAGGIYHFSYNDPKDLKIIAPYIYHVHAKFFGMEDNLTEYSIPYPEIIKSLRDIGYQGYLSTEFENYAWIPASPQIRLQHAMLRGLLAKQ
jgi:sugar phosphate isomerase/epimerase